MQLSCVTMVTELPFLSVTSIYKPGKTSCSHSTATGISAYTLQSELSKEINDWWEVCIERWKHTHHQNGKGKSEVTRDCWM